MTTRFQQAYETFHSQLPTLLAQGYSGLWVLFHGEMRIALDENRDKLFQIAQVRGIPDEEIFVDLIASEPEDIDAESILFR